MKSVAKCVQLYRAQCNAEQMLKDEAERRDETRLAVEEDDETEEHVVKAVSEETPKVVEEARLEELPKPSTRTSWTRLCLWICVSVVAIVLVLSVVESQTPQSELLQQYKQLAHSKMKEWTMTTAQKEEQDRLDKLEQDRLDKLEQAKLKAKFDVAAEAFTAMKKCTIGWVPTLYDAWAWPWGHAVRCMSGPVIAGGKFVKHTFS